MRSPIPCCNLCKILANTKVFSVNNICITVVNEPALSLDDYVYAAV